MSLLNDILALAPPEWEEASYADKRFVLKDVDETTPEFGNVKSKLSSLWEIEKIQRIQHPYAYGRFLIRKKQLESRSQCPSEAHNLEFVTDENQLETILNYNCDYRRGGVCTISGSSALVIMVHFMQSSSSDSNSYPEYLITRKPKTVPTETERICAQLAMLQLPRLY